MARDTSDLKVWFREDILCALAGVNAANAVTDASPEFRDGFEAALFAVATVIGCDTSKILVNRATGRVIDNDNGQRKYPLWLVAEK